MTFQGYETLVRTQVRPYFEELGLRVSEVTRDVLQTYFDEKRLHGRLDGKGGLSPRTLRLHKNILHQTLNAAVLDGIIPKNPCEFVSLPSNQRFEAHYYNMTQVNRLLSLIHDEPLYPLIRFTAVYGVRRSEVLGLQWDCVDFENGTISITRTVVKVTTIVEKNRTKNESSRRSFPMTDDIRKPVKKLRRIAGRSRQRNQIVNQGSFAALIYTAQPANVRAKRVRCSRLLLPVKEPQFFDSLIKVTANIYGHLDVRRKQSMANALGAGLSDS